MKNILIDISGKLDNSYISAIKEIKKVTDSLKISFFIVGAFARDIIMEYFYGIKAPRMTMDIDLGIRVSSWNQFDLLINTLELNEDFKKLKEKQRVIYKDNIKIDIIPFGSISNQNEEISWPPENEVVMSVLGFNEVYNNSTLVILQNNPLLEVKTPTLPGLAILKLLSWKDSSPRRTRDAEDLLFIVKKYEFTGIEDKLYKSELQLLQNEDFDNQIAGIVLLGKEMSKICTNKTIGYLKKIIYEETSENSDYNLIKDMMQIRSDDFDRILFLLRKLKEGIYYRSGKNI
jgi:predicted nucleotidyltransferase